MNKCYLEGGVEKLKIQLEELGYEGFINRYKKVDIFIGDSEMIKFIEEKLKNQDN